jgi:protein-disulfide isomerase
MQVRVGRWCVWLVLGAGLLVAGMTGVSEHAPALGSLCFGVADSCRETAQFVLFGMPVWAWGAVYYLALGVSLAFSPQWMPLLAAAGLGAELHLAWIMVSRQLPCTLCLANLVVVLLLAGLCLTREKFWPAATLCLLALLVSQAAVGRGNLAPAPAAIRAGDAVVARVGGAAITAAELDTSLSSSLTELNEQIYRLRQDRLDAMVRERVLKLEAAAQGLSVGELVKQEVEPRTAPVTEAEVKAVAEEHRAEQVRYRWSEEELLDRTRGFLNRKKADAALRSYAGSLYPRYAVQTLLAAPQQPVLDVDPGDSPSLGPADARVTVVEFSDYECPACRRGHATVQAMREKYRDRVRWVFKDYPLSMHKHARLAAEAGRCGGEQGRFWEIQDRIYAAGDLTRPGLEQVAGDLGLDRERFAGCLDEKRFAAAVDRDLAEVERLGLDATPTFVINGRPVGGTPSPEKFSAILDAALAEAAAKP